MRHITCPHCGDTYPDFDVAHVCSKGPYAPQLKYKMNEQIDKLMVKAGAYFGAEGVVYDTFDPKKFAELIIEECLRMCDCAEASLLEHSYPRESDGAASVKIFIKEHFGVVE